jgi:hypothetical protein
LNLDCRELLALRRDSGSTATVSDPLIYRWYPFPESIREFSKGKIDAITKFERRLGAGNADLIPAETGILIVSYAAETAERTGTKIAALAVPYEEYILRSLDMQIIKITHKRKGSDGKSTATLRLMNGEAA